MGGASLNNSIDRCTCEILFVSHDSVQVSPLTSDWNNILVN